MIQAYSTKSLPNERILTLNIGNFNLATFYCKRR
jgi:hypothetical protein